MLYPCQLDQSCTIYIYLPIALELIINFTQKSEILKIMDINDLPDFDTGSPCNKCTSSVMLFKLEFFKLSFESEELSSSSLHHTV